MNEKMLELKKLEEDTNKLIKRKFKQFKRDITENMELYKSGKITKEELKTRLGYVDGRQ